MYATFILSEKRLIEMGVVLVGSVHTNPALVTLTWFSSACDFWSFNHQPHTCFRLGTTDCWFIPVWVHGNHRAAVLTHRFVILVLQWPSCALMFPQQGCLHTLHHHVKRLSQHSGLIWKYTDDLMMHINAKWAWISVTLSLRVVWIVTLDPFSICLHASFPHWRVFICFLLRYLCGRPFFFFLAERRYPHTNLTRLKSHKTYQELQNSPRHSR